jgi:hypothetical protein
MAVYLVTWDLNKEKPNYAQARSAFISHLDNFDNIKDPGLDSVRFISTTWSVYQIDEYLRQRLDSNDRLMVVQLGTHQGWIQRTVWDWINARL